MAAGDGGQGIERGGGGIRGPARALLCLGLSLGLGVAAFVMLASRLGYPYHRLAALILWGVALAVFAWSLRARRKWLRVHKKLAKRRLRPYTPHLVVGTGLAAFAYVAWVLMPVEPSALTGMTGEDLRAHLDTDRSLTEYLDRSLESAVTAIAATIAESGAPQILTPSQRESLFEAWQQFVHASLELDGLSRKYRGFYQIEHTLSPDLHADAFLLAYAAYAAQYHRALTLVKLADSAPTARAALNEPSAVYGIPGQTFFRLKQRLTHPDTVLRLNAGRAYLRLVERDITAGPDSVARLRAQLGAVDRLAGSKADLWLGNPLDWLERNAHRVWFPVQRRVALRMSDVRGKNRPYFISPELARECLALLQPGDILLERRSWHLTNAGIPGFWPHSALFTGSPPEMDAYFDGLPELEGNTASVMLAEEFPEVWAQYQAASDSPRRVIEVKRPGVILTTLEESAHADYLAALRPRVSRSQKFLALRRAFAHFGKPYDFDFDFATDRALVCSELVYKAYQGMEGIGWSPRIVNGRLLLSPNDFARLFAEEADSEERSLDWVLFLDGREAEETVDWGTEAGFRDSWRRPKWEILLR